MSSEKKTKMPSATRAGRWSLWPWFVAGFLIVFVIMLVSVRGYAMQQQGVVECVLWQYYLLEIQSSLHANALGPGSNSGAAAVLVQHLLCALVGGGMLLAIAWGVQTVRQRRGTLIGRNRS